MVHFPLLCLVCRSVPGTWFSPHLIPMDSKSNRQFFTLVKARLLSAINLKLADDQTTCKKLVGWKIRTSFSYNITLQATNIFPPQEKALLKIMFPFPTALEGSIGIWSSWCIHIPSSMDWTRQTMDLWSVSDSTSSAPLWQLLTTLFPLLELDWWTFTSRLDGCKDRNTLGVEDGWKRPCPHLPGVEVTKKTSPSASWREN